MSNFINKLKARIEKVQARTETLDVTHYTDENTNLNCLVSKIEKWFEKIKFPTQVVEGDGKWLVQARKNNYLRSLIAGNRSIDVLIEGSSDNFKIQISTGKWINNIVMTGCIAFLTFGAAAAPLGVCTVWVLKIKRELKEFIDIMIKFEKHESNHITE